MAAVLVLSVAGIMTAGQLGYWAFDEGSGTTVKDSSGKGNNGTLVGGPLWVDGKFGKALQFDGVDDYVQVPHNASLIPTTGKATVSVWINAKRHTGPGGSSVARHSGQRRSPAPVQPVHEVSRVIHFSTGPSGAYIGPLSTGHVPLNEWVHVAVVVDNRDFFYLNGEPAGEGGTGPRFRPAGPPP